MCMHGTHVHMEVSKQWPHRGLDAYAHAGRCALKRAFVDSAYLNLLKGMRIMLSCVFKAAQKHAYFAYTTIIELIALRKLCTTMEWKGPQRIFPPVSSSSCLFKVATAIYTGDTLTVLHFVQVFACLDGLEVLGKEGIYEIAHWGLYAVSKAILLQSMMSVT